MLIRKIKQDDVNEVFEVFKNVWISTYPNETYNITKESILKRFDEQTKFLKLKESIPKYGIRTEGWVCEYDSKVVGVAITNIENEKCQVGAMYILENYQRKGIGKLFLDKIFDFRKDFKEIYTEVAIYNEVAINFYKKHGFEILPGTEGKHTVIDDVYIPTIQMRKELISK